MLGSGRRYGCCIKTFLYFHCNDLDATRRFYSDLLGLAEIYFSAEDGTVGYRAGTLQITFAMHDTADHVDGWARQLGWSGGTVPTPSWGIECTRDQFRGAVEATRSAGVDARFGEPQWVGYWSYPVKDPMGYTVEISAPDAEAWP